MLGFGKKRASNEVIQAVPVFEGDPNGAALFHGLTNQIAAHLNGPRPVMDLSTDGNFGGWADAGQRMHGLAVLSAGSGRPVVAPGTTFDQETAFGSWTPSERIFLQRMEQGRLS